MTINSDSLLYQIAKVLKGIGWRTAYDRLHEYQHLNHFTRKSLKKLLDNRFKFLESINHNYSFEAIDVPNNNFLYKLIVINIYSMSSLLNKQILQTVVYKKRIHKGYQ